MKPRKMKDSGIPWIGQIPEGWEVRRLKRAGSIIVDKCIPDDCGAGDGLMYLGLEHVESQTGHLVRDYEPIRDFAGDAIRFDKGNVLFGKLRPYLAKCWLADTEGKCSSEFFVLKPDDQCIGKYLNWTMLSYRFIDLVDGSTFGVKMPRAEWSFVGGIHMPFPSSDEQARIATYLDGKCGEIDRVIAAKERQNELLQSQRAALISETVTKGLNPKAKFKDSGIEWIGKIPEGWRIQRLKTFARINPEIVLDNNVFADATSVSFIPMENLRTGSHTTTAIEYSEVKSGYVTFADGDILMAKVTPCFENGNIAIAHALEHGIGFGSTEILVVRAMDVSRKYLFYYLQDPAFKKKAISEMYGASGLKRLSPTFMENCHYPFPSPHEQEQIAAYLDVRCGEIDRVMAANEGMVARLKAYRSSVIWEAVTGKKCL